VLHPGQATTVVYTSGTTGNPKGVLLSHDNMIYTGDMVKKNVITEVPPNGEHRIVSYLPLNHVAGQMLDIIAPLSITAGNTSGQYVTVYFPAQCFIKTKLCFKEALKDAKPTLFLGVPKVWDGLLQKLQTAAENPVVGMLKNMLPSAFLGAVGLNKVIWAISGAGMLSNRTLQYFRGLGINILNMYAQSESSALGTAWSNELFKANTDRLGNIGQAMGNEVQIRDPDSKGQGEVALKGRNVMLGYLNRPDKTAKTITEDGWLLTGDKARKDEKGFVYLTGRIKDIMKDAGGEMIAPAAVEAGIMSACNPEGKGTVLNQAIVVGDGKYYISVLLTLSEHQTDSIPDGELVGGAKDVDPNCTTVADARQSDMWRTALASCIGNYNKQAQKAVERVYRYAILPKDITGDDAPDLMTPTFKIKRQGVNKEYAELIKTCGGDKDLEKAERKVQECR